MNKAGASTRSKRLNNVVLSLMLALSLILGLMPTLAFAEEQEQQPEQNQLEIQSQTTEEEQSKPDRNTSIVDDSELKQEPATNPLMLAPSMRPASTNGGVGTMESDEVAVVYVYPPETGESSGTQEVLIGKIGFPAPAPTGSVDPASYGMVSFRGWFTVENPLDDAQPYDFSRDLTIEDQEKGLTLYAVFSSTYLMSYKDQDGKVVQTDRLNPGMAIYGPTQETLDLIVPPEGTRLVHWYVEGDTKKEAFNFGSSIMAQKDLIFCPYFSDNYLVIFNSFGSPIESQMVVKGEYASKPEDPTRAGYDFQYWYEESKGDATAFDFSTPIEEDIVLLGKWIGKEVPYTVAIWMEKPNFDGTPTPGNLGDYNYVTSTTMNALAGTQTNLDIDNLPADTGSLFDGSSSNILKYATPQSVESKEIQGNGNTVINLYAKRTTYTFIFNLGTNESNTMTVGGITYTGDSTDKYSIQVKFEMDMSHIFPVQGASFAEFNGNFSSWSRPESLTWKDNAGIASIRKYVDDSLLSEDGQTKEYEFSATWDASGDSYNYRYFVKAYPSQDVSSEITITDGGITYVLMPEYNQKYQGSLNAKNINGLTRVKAGHTMYYYNAGEKTYYSEEDPEREAHRCFFYTREFQSLTFNMMTPEGETVEGIPSDENMGFDEPLAGYQPNPNPSIESGNYSFAGWYLDADYKEEFDFTSLKMPNGGITAYAKWESTDNAVIFLDGRGGTEVGRQGVASGAHAADLTTTYLGLDVEGFAKDKGKFLGWYYDISGIPVKWSFDNNVHQDYTLYATWQTSGFRIHYDSGVGDGTAPEDPNTYNMYKTARVLSGTNLEPPSDQMFYAWKDKVSGRIYYPGDFIVISETGNVSLVAQYASPVNLVKVTYFATDNQGEKHENYVLKDTTINLAGEIFTLAEKELIGWNTDSGQSVAEYQLGQQYPDPITGNIQFYGVWKEQEKEPLSLTIGSQTGSLTKAYGESDPAFNWKTKSGVEAVDSWLANNTQYVSRLSGEDVSTYTIDVNTEGRNALEAAFPQYQFSVEPGSFEITPRGITVTAQAGGGSYTGSPYYGGDLTITGQAANNPNLGIEDVFSAQKAGSRTDVGGSDEKEATAFWTLVNKDSEDISSSPNYRITIVNADIVVTPNMTAVITIDAGSVSKVYDGADLTSLSYTTGTLPIGITSITATTSGSQINAGSSQNKIASYTLWNGMTDVTKNYGNVTLNPGILTVDQRPLTLTAGSISGPYTGEAYTVSTYSQNGLVPGHSITGVSVNSSATLAGTYTVGFSGSPLIMNGGTQVQNNYAISYAPGTISITGAVIPFIAPTGTETAVDEPEAIPAPSATIESPDTPRSQLQTIDDPEVPLASALHWALVNLIIAIACFVVGVILSVAFFRNARKKDGTETLSTKGDSLSEEDNKHILLKTGLVWRIIGIVTAIAAPILFIMTENISLSMQLVDSWTILMAAILVVQLGAVFLLRRSRNTATNKEEAGAPQY